MCIEIFLRIDPENNQLSLQWIQLQCSVSCKKAFFVPPFSWKRCARGSKPYATKLCRAAKASARRTEEHTGATAPLATQVGTGLRGPRIHCGRHQLPRRHTRAKLTLSSTPRIARLQRPLPQPTLMPSRTILVRLKPGVK